MNCRRFSIFFFSVLFFSACNKNTSVSSTNIKVAGLFSITGNWSSLGKNSQQAMNLAVTDINKYLESCNSPYRFSSMVYDTGLDTTTAKTSIQKAYTEQNIRFIIGPQSSAELGAIRQYANDHNMLVISQGSTASNLAIPNDALFRFCPGDAVEGSAISRTMFSAGKKVIITIARNDAGNIGLQTSVGSNFTGLGGKVEALTPYETNTTNFASVIQQIKTKIQQHTATYPASQIGVYIGSFDECVNLFNQASTDPVLTSVNWYGGDGMVQSSALLADVPARNFAVATGFFAPNFGLPMQAHPSLNSIYNSITASTGIKPDAYALSVYDAMWVIAKTVASHPGVLTDFGKLKTDFNTEANQFFGITGPVLLNNNGDRTIGSFDYWGITNQGGTYSWTVVGKSN